MELDLTYVIPCKNVMSYSRQLFSVIKDATDIGIAVILIENNSTDNTLPFLHERCNLRNIKLFSTSKVGAPSARNIGLKAVDTNFVKFLDADDIPIGSMVKEHLKNLQIKDFDFSTSLHFIRGLDRERLDVDFRLPQSDDIPFAILSGNIGVTSGAIFKTSSLLDIDGFDENLTCNQERDLYWRLYRKGCKYYAFNSFTFVKKVMNNSISHTTPKIEKEKNQRALEQQIRSSLQDEI